MKNKTTSLPADNGKPVTYGSLFEIALRAGRPATQQNPSGGLTPTEMMDRYPLLQKVRETEPEADFEFTAEEIVKLRNIWENHHFPMHFDEVLDITVQLKAEAEKPRKD